MRCATLLDPSGQNAGTVEFVDARRRADRLIELEGDGHLVATLGPLGEAQRGRLRELLEEAVERALAQRRAPPPGLRASEDLDATLSDQLFRARRAGCAGIAIAVGSLASAARRDGALHGEDAEVLGFLAGAARERPLVLLLDDGSRRLQAHGPPVPLAALLGATPEGDGARHDVEARGEAPERDGGDDDELAESLAEVGRMLLELDRDLAGAAGAVAEGGAPPAEVAAEVDDAPPPSDGVEEHEVEGGGADDDADHEPLEQATARTPRPPRAVQLPLRLPPRDAPAATPHVTLGDAARWRGYAQELDSARGPKPLAAVERLFVDRYVPLLSAIQRGEADATVIATVEAWRESFARSYAETFPTFRVTRKRPPMVLDAPAIATNLARLHGARSVQLLLVDAMRFDLGERVEELLRGALTGTAVEVERVLLWAALPTVTVTQMALLARGPEGLREAAPSSDRELAVARGRLLASIRRERIGARDVMKLDLAEGRLRGAGEAPVARLQAIAGEVAEAVVRHIASLPPRTLVLLFGDHGFQLRGGPAGSEGATQGGASPEEVIVPAYAWLTGGVH